jgi:hypothetical protein
VVHTVEKVEKIKPEPYVIEKIVIQNDIHASGVEIRLEKPVPMNYETIKEVQRPINYISEKEVPKEIFREKLVDVRSII